MYPIPQPPFGVGTLRQFDPNLMARLLPALLAVRQQTRLGSRNDMGLLDEAQPVRGPYQGPRNDMGLLDAPQPQPQPFTPFTGGRLAGLGAALGQLQHAFHRPQPRNDMGLLDPPIPPRAPARRVAGIDYGRGVYRDPAGRLTFKGQVRQPPRDLRGPLFDPRLGTRLPGRPVYPRKPITPAMLRRGVLF